MDANKPKTSLSAGLIIKELLTQDTEVAKITKQIIPVITDEAKLPYVIYRRSGFEQLPTEGVGKADTITVEVTCCAKNYLSSIALAEAVRGALDGKQAEAHGIAMRSCYLTDGDEGYQDDAYIQNLIFTIKI